MIQLTACCSASASHGSALAASVAGRCGARPRSRGRAPGRRRDAADLVDVGVAEAARDRRAGRVDDLLDDTDEELRLLERAGDEDGAAFEDTRQAGHRVLHDRVVQRVAGSEQVGPHQRRRAARSRGRR